MKTLTRTILFTAGLLAGFSGTALAETTGQIKAVRDIAPEYPASALRRDASGYVVVRFDLDRNGRARNVEIVESNPQRLFDSSVLTAVRKSVFEISGDASATDVERVYRFNPAERSEQNQISMHNAFHQ